MTSQEFVIWLKGFTEGVHDFNITPKQWDLLKERLAEVEDDVQVGTPIGVGGFGTPSGTDHDLVQRYPWGSPVTWGNVGGERSIPSVWKLSSLTGSLATSGSSTITVSSGSTISGITTTLYPNGTTVSYTTTGGPTWYSVNKIENDSREK